MASYISPTQNRMYASRPAMVYGFHGTDEDVGRKILNGKEQFRSSDNDYDWLGQGVYFWENNLERAKIYADQDSKRPRSSIKNPFVLGTVIELGKCLDLLDQEWLDYLKQIYPSFKDEMAAEGNPLPTNDHISPSDTERKARNLDNAVIRYACDVAKQTGNPFDSVRSAFIEGEPLYEGSVFRSENHIQLAIINLDCIKGVFLPRESQD